MPVGSVVKAAESAVRYERQDRRDRRLLGLGYESYEAYIRSPEWAEVRRRYFKARTDFGCVLCPRTDRIILHHRTYERVGTESLDDLIALCPECHAFVHGLERDGYIGSLDPAEIRGLSDGVRQDENREREQKREARQRLEFEQTRTWVRREVKAQVHRLREARLRASKKSVDVSAEIEIIDKAIKRIVEKCKT